MAWRKHFTKTFTYRRGIFVRPMSRRFRHRSCPNWISYQINCFNHLFRSSVQKLQNYSYNQKTNHKNIFYSKNRTHYVRWEKNQYNDVLYENTKGIQPIQAKRSKNGREYFRLGAESYSSLGRVGKKRRK